MFHEGFVHEITLGWQTWLHPLGLRTVLPFLNFSVVRILTSEIFRVKLGPKLHQGKC